MTQQYTPEPWHAGGPRPMHFDQVEVHVIDDEFGQHIALVMVDHYGNELPAAANADLIAAAPELLTAAVGYAELLEADHYKCDLDTEVCYDDFAPQQHETIREVRELIADAARAGA